MSRDIDYCCFYCQNFMHDNPDYDYCLLTCEEVHFDSHICENFVEDENAVKSF